MKKTLKRYDPTSQYLQNHGFTLVEIAVVIMVAGTLLVPMFQMYSIYDRNQKVEVTKETIKIAAGAMNTFSVSRLPCPSDRSLPVTSVLYGVENCRMTSTAVASGSAQIPFCNAIAPAIKGICITTGSRDTRITEDLPVTSVGPTNVADTTTDLVVIGGIPFRSYNAGTGTYTEIADLRAIQTTDGWGNKLTYAVSANLMDNTKQNSRDDYQYGVISAIDEFGNPTAGIGTYDLNNADADNNVNTGTDGDAQFAIISHGPTGRGAFNRDGIPNVLACAATADSENCDNDSTFIQALGNYEANNNGFYDDLTYFYTERGGDLWYRITNTNGTLSDHIANMNTRNVGIGTDTPVTKLDVVGTIQASGLNHDWICDKGDPTTGVPSTCMSAYFRGAIVTLSGGSYDVPPVPTVNTPATIPNNKANGCRFSDGAARGIKFGNFWCDWLKVYVRPLASGGAAVSCAGDGNFMQGILTNGCIICMDGTKPCPP